MVRRSPLPPRPPRAPRAACHAAVLGPAGAPSRSRAARARPPTSSSAAARSSTTSSTRSRSRRSRRRSCARARATSERIEIYRLLAYNYIILKRNDEADTAVRGILVLDEGFTLPPTESPRFRDFFAATKQKWMSEGKPGKATAARRRRQAHPDAHASPAEAPAGSAVKLSGAIDDPDGRVRGVQLSYRTGSKGKFVTVGGDVHARRVPRARIPGLARQAAARRVLLSAVDKGGLPLVSRGDAARPLRVVVPRERRRSSRARRSGCPLGLAVVGGAIAGDHPPDAVQRADVDGHGGRA